MIKRAKVAATIAAGAATAVLAMAPASVAQQVRRAVRGGHRPVRMLMRGGGTRRRPVARSIERRQATPAALRRRSRHRRRIGPIAPTVVSSASAIAA